MQQLQTPGYPGRAELLKQPWWMQISHVIKMEGACGAETGANEAAAVFHPSRTLSSKGGKRKNIYGEPGNANANKFKIFICGARGR